MVLLINENQEKMRSIVIIKLQLQKIVSLYCNSYNSLIISIAYSLDGQILILKSLLLILKKDNLNIEEKFIMKNYSNEYDENNYEKSVQKNMANLIVENLILQLSRM